MPSPFPGMDPYLENPDDFPDLHDSILIGLKQLLQPLLPPPYVARTRRRVWIEQPEQSRFPDVAILRGDGQTRPVAEYGAVRGMMEAGAVVVEAEPDFAPEVYELTLEITRIDRRGEAGRLVTSIELLSPSNKWRSGAGRSEFLRKQRELLGRDVHLVEIDLLRGGVHSTAVPLAELRREAGPFDYHVSIRDFGSPGRFFTYPIRLEDRLPTIGVPLLPEDGVRTADLQAVFDRAYEGSGFARDVNYAIEPPAPPLSPERLTWLRDRVAAWRETRFPGKD